MTVLGLGLILAAVVADLGPLVTVTGMLLAVAGIVKIVMLAIWKSFFAIPVDTPARTDRPPAGGGPSEGKV
jgi:uncharacterized protein involved in response to NO